MTTTSETKNKNGIDTKVKLDAEDAIENSRARVEGSDGVYNIRDTVLFSDHTIEPVQNVPRNKHVIRIVPNNKDERVLLARIFMHKTAAESLVLERLAIGERVITRGAGTCEMFLANIPNWTPQGLYIDEQNPLVMLVSNMRNFPIRTVGSVVVFRKG